MTEDEWRGGLGPDYDYMLTEKPQDPEMRESASIWLYEENGEFALPRIGIEAIGADWEHHDYYCNFAFPDGRALYDTRSDADSHSPFDEDGKPTVLGSGPLRFQCIEPYRKWRVTYDGDPIDSTTAEMTRGLIESGARTPVRFDIELTMAAPCWTQDYTPEKVAKMSKREQEDARSMGLGHRLEQLFRAKGTLEIDGKSRAFKASGLRVHRQSVRPLDAFRGHVWQSAVFPDGRAFGYIAYPPAEDGSTYNDGYVYVDGKWYPAQATIMPWLETLTAESQDASLELQCELGRFAIKGTTCLNTFKIYREGYMGGFTLQQGGVEYDWDGQRAFGMIERSTWIDEVKSAA